MPTEVTAQFTNTSTVRVTWQWTSSGPAPDCFNSTTVTYHPEGRRKSSQQLSDPAATEATLTDLQCNTTYMYTITVVATAGEHRRERTVLILLQGILNIKKSVFIHNVMGVYHGRSTEPLSSCVDFYLSASDLGGSLPYTAVPYLLQGNMWDLC